MIHQLLATKRQMTQAWTKSGVRIPVTILRANDCMVIGKGNTDGRILVGGSAKKLKNMNKPQRSQLEKAGISVGFSKVQEIKVDGDDMNLAAGSALSPSAVLSIGDIVKVTGTSKGSGFTGVMKRHGFHGGSRTHGQSDRARAPGSIGAGTTPGRVYKQKRMAGRAGNEQVTVIGLQVVALDEKTGEVWVKGLVPGAMNGSVLITKIESREFEGLLHGPKVEEVTSPETAVETEVQEVSAESVSQVEEEKKEETPAVEVKNLEEKA